MKIEIQLEPIAGDTNGAYAVHIIDADGEMNTPGKIGTVYQIAPGEWQFKPPGFKEGDHALTVHAEGVESLRKAIQARCFKIEAAPPQAMPKGLAQAHTFSVLRSLNLLAHHTETLSGFYAGVAEAMGDSMVEDFKGEDQEGARAAFIECLDKFVSKAKAREEKTARLREAVEGGPFGDLVKDLLRTFTDDDTPTTKH